MVLYAVLFCLQVSLPVALVIHPLDAWCFPSRLLCCSELILYLHLYNLLWSCSATYCWRKYAVQSQIRTVVDVCLSWPWVFVCRTGLLLNEESVGSILLSGHSFGHQLAALPAPSPRFTLSRFPNVPATSGAKTTLDRTFPWVQLLRLCVLCALRRRNGRGRVCVYFCFCRQNID